jgi:hypothetical protein
VFSAFLFLSEQKHKEFSMKKVRFFGLLAATVLLAFALVVACSNGTTEPPDGPGPVEPNGPPAYSIPPGGTAPGTTPIQGPGAATPTGIRLNRTAISLKVGDQAQIYATVLPDRAAWTRIVWTTTSGTDVIVSGTGTTGTVIGRNLGSTDAPVVNTISAQLQLDVGNTPVNIGPAIECEVTLYHPDVLKGSDVGQLASLGWDLLKTYRDGATGIKLNAVTSAADVKIRALSMAAIKDFAAADSQAYLSSRADTPAKLISSGTYPQLEYYPVMGNAAQFALDFEKTGWAFAALNNSDVVTGKADGNTIGVGSGPASRVICYPVDGVAPEDWTRASVRVVPSAEVTVTMPYSILASLDADELIKTAQQGTTPILKLINTDPAINVKVSGSDADSLKNVNNTTLTRTFLLQANYANTKVQFLSIVEQHPSPKEYTLTLTPGSLGGSTQVSGTYTEYVPWLESRPYTLELKRADAYPIPSITIRGLGPLEHDQDLSSTSTADIDVVGANIAASIADNVKWYVTAPTESTRTPGVLNTAVGGQKAYARIVLQPNTGYAFSPNVVVSCVGTPAGETAEVSFATATRFFGGVSGNSSTHLVIVLEFDVELAEIETVSFDLKLPTIGDGPQSQRNVTVTTTPADAVTSPATVSWNQGNSGWDSTAAVAGDVFTAVIEIVAVAGYEFGEDFDTINADSFAAADALINFDGYGDIGATAPTATRSTNRRTLTVTVVFKALVAP